MTLTWTSLDHWIAATGLLAAVACALPGCFLVLRRMSMMGDAISHAVLPGLAAAFLITGSRGSFPMLIGAVACGVFTALATDWVHRRGRVEHGAAMGVVFTSLFALGLVLIVRGADAVDLDPGCVLYGAIELTPLDTVALGGVDVPRAAIQLAVVTLVNIAVIVIFFKELKLTSFDPEFAESLGYRAARMHTLLMVMTATTAVAAFESVGSILVVAMLIVPAAAAHLLTDRLWSMLLVAAGIGAVAAVAGHLAAITLPQLVGYPDTNTAGMMAVVAGGLLTVIVFLGPRHGVMARRYRRRTVLRR